MSTEGSRLVTNHKEYSDAFHVFTRNRREQQISWVESKLVPKIRDVFIQDFPTPKSEFKILAVGSNEGSFDCLFIKTLFTNAKELVEGKEVVYTVVEPNAGAIDEFKRNVSSQEAFFQNVNFKWVNKSMEEFLEATEPEEYDLIHFVHVLYYVGNEDEMLRSSYNRLLSSPGCILAVVITEENVWVKLTESFKEKIPTLELKQLTNVELSEICKRNGWSYEIFDAKLDLEVTEVFNEDDPVGQAILKFFLHANEEPKKAFGKEKMAEVVEFFGKMSWEKMKDGEKCLFVNEDEGILLVYKHS